jgi:four helix bundle protein
VATFRCFEDIDAWKKARQLTDTIFQLTKSGPFSRDYALRDQVRRACISTMSNIAEGFERDGAKEFVQFLSMAKGSLGELRSQLYIALDQKYVDAEAFTALTKFSVEISKMIRALMIYLRKTSIKGAKYR